MDLGIGTAQFGFSYGVSNAGGKVDPKQAKQILALCTQRCVSVVDTAYSYGESENVIGSGLPSNHGLKIVTKIPPLKDLPPRNSSYQGVREIVATSLSRLNQSSIYGLLVHDVNDLYAPYGADLYRAMQDLQSEGRVSRIGVSIYSDDEIDRVLENFDIHLLQAPVSIFDQRLVTGGHLERLKDHSVEIHARSIFLQGLLLMRPEELPGHFDRVRPLLLKYQETVRNSGLTLIQAALNYVKNVEAVDCAIVGVTSPTEFEEVCAAWAGSRALTFEPARFSLNDVQIINPTFWPADA